MLKIGHVDELGSDIYDVQQTKTGRDVVELQRQLMLAGFYEVGCVDGVYGSKTFDAITHLQEKYELQRSGTFGYEEQAALSDALIEGRNKRQDFHIVFDVDFRFQGVKGNDTFLSNNSPFFCYGGLVCSVLMYFDFMGHREVVNSDLDPGSIFDFLKGVGLDIVTPNSSEIYRRLKSDIPTIALVEYKIGNISCSHFVLIIGVTASGHLIHDPGTPKGNGYKFYPRNFLEKTRRFGGYTMTKIFVEV